MRKAKLIKMTIVIELAIPYDSALTERQHVRASVDSLSRKLAGPGLLQVEDDFASGYWSTERRDINLSDPAAAA